MGNEQYLIPANSKKSMLILGFFNPTDLIILGTGLTLTFILLLALESKSFKTALFIISPGLISAMLLIPLPHHHNVRTFIYNVYNYFANRRTFYWRGWCIKNGEK